MDFNAQFIAGAIAGIISPFVQEILFGAKISGRLAGFVAIATTFIVAALATWATGGFATANAAPAFSLLDPSAFFAFWWKLWLPVYGIAQVVYSTTTHQNGTGFIQTVSAPVQKALGTGSAVLPPPPPPEPTPPMS